jgi:hypothetical protein
MAKTQTLLLSATEVCVLQRVSGKKSSTTCITQLTYTRLLRRSGGLDVE